jgi:hypothetical protein
MCQRRNDFQRLAGLSRLLLRRQEAHGAHVVQSVGDLDDQHPPVAGHGDDHLADRLRVSGGTQGDLVQLGDAVDQMRHLLAEVGGQLFHRVAGVLDGVVQQRGDQRGGVHAEFGQDVGNGQRMGDVRVTRAAQLVGMPLLGHLVGLLQQRQIGLRKEPLVHGDERLEHRIDGAALGGHPSCQPGPHPPRRAGGGPGDLQRLRFRQLHCRVRLPATHRRCLHSLSRAGIVSHGHLLRLRLRGYPSHRVQAADP